MIAVSTEDLSASEIEARQKTMAEALAALKRGEDFEDVAHKYSEDPSSQDGGVLPFLSGTATGPTGWPVLNWKKLFQSWVKVSSPTL
jgi:hypothetical protein